jgi:hypothetical protein
MSNVLIDLSDEPYESPLRIEGRALVVTSGTRLPPICVLTNQPVTEDDMVRQEYYWCSPWYALLILGGLLLYVVFYLIARKQCILTYGLHPDMKRMYRKRVLIKSLVMIGFVIAFMAGAGANSGVVMGLTALGMFGALLSFFIGNTPLAVKKCKYGKFWIKGFSPEYLHVVSKFAG